MKDDPAALGPTSARRDAVVVLVEGGDLGRAITHFSRAWVKSCIARELRNRSRYVKPGEKRRANAARAWRHRLRFASPACKRVKEPARMSGPSNR